MRIVISIFAFLFLLSCPVSDDDSVKSTEELLVAKQFGWLWTSVGNELEEAYYLARDRSKVALNDGRLYREPFLGDTVFSFSKEMPNGTIEGLDKRLRDGIDLMLRKIKSLGSDEDVELNKLRRRLTELTKAGNNIETVRAFVELMQEVPTKLTMTVSKESLLNDIFFSVKDIRMLNDFLVLQIARMMSREIPEGQNSVSIQLQRKIRIIATHKKEGKGNELELVGYDKVFKQYYEKLDGLLAQLEKYEGEEALARELRSRYRDLAETKHFLAKSLTMFAPSMANKELDEINIQILKKNPDSPWLIF